MRLPLQVYNSIVYKLLFFIFLSTSSLLSAQSIQSSPEAIKIKQPDGSKLTIVGNGNMYVSYTETTDSFTLVKNKKEVYEYALAQADGDLIASGIKAHDQKCRKKKEKNFLKHTPKQLRYTGKKLEDLQNKIQKFNGQ